MLASDAIYPDPNLADGSKQPYRKHDCGKYSAAKVIATSYGTNEADLSPAYEERQCNE